MTIEYEEIKQTPLENLITTYQFLCGDLSEGLVYGVSKKVVTQAESVILTHLKEIPILDATNSRTFCKTLYPYLKKIGV